MLVFETLVDALPDVSSVRRIEILPKPVTVSHIVAVRLASFVLQIDVGDTEIDILRRAERDVATRIRADVLRTDAVVAVHDLREAPVNLKTTIFPWLVLFWKMRASRVLHKLKKLEQRKRLEEEQKKKLDFAQRKKHVEEQKRKLGEHKR